MYPKATDQKAIPVKSSNDRIHMPLEYGFGLWKRWTDWRIRKNAEKYLMAMSDVSLKDIGISRGQISGAIKLPRDL